MTSKIYPEVPFSLVVPLTGPLTRFRLPATVSAAFRAGCVWRLRPCLSFIVPQTPHGVLITLKGGQRERDEPKLWLHPPNQSFYEPTSTSPALYLTERTLSSLEFELTDPQWHLPMPGYGGYLRLALDLVSERVMEDDFDLWLNVSAGPHRLPLPLLQRRDKWRVGVKRVIFMPLPGPTWPVADSSTPPVVKATFLPPNDDEPVRVEVKDLTLTPDELINDFGLLVHKLNQAIVSQYPQWKRSSWARPLQALHPAQPHSPNEDVDEYDGPHPSWTPLRLSFSSQQQRCVLLSQVRGQLTLPPRLAQKLGLISPLVLQPIIPLEALLATTLSQSSLLALTSPFVEPTLVGEKNLNLLKILMRPLQGVEHWECSGSPHYVNLAPGDLQEMQLTWRSLENVPLHPSSFTSQVLLSFQKVKE